MERLKIAISGASGFIGANLADYFSKNNEVTLLTRNIKSWRLLDKEATFLDITDREKVLNTIKRINPDIMIHCAVYGGYHFETDTKNIIKTNITGTINLLDACKNVNLFINTGSSSEYGIKYHSMKEADSVEPNTDYAMSKALITNMLRAKDKKYPKAVTMRLFSAYGYYEEKHRLIPYLLRSIITGEKATLSNKNNVRDFVFVEDVARAYELTVQKHNKIETGDIFNVGSGQQTKIADLVRILKADVKWNSRIRAKESDRAWKADISKIKKTFGWEPKNSLKEGLKKTAIWMKENLEMYSDEKNDKSRRS